MYIYIYVYIYIAVTYKLLLYRPQHMARKAEEDWSLRGHLLGLILLFIVNLCWVGAAEISRVSVFDVSSIACNFKKQMHSLSYRHVIICDANVFDVCDV